MSDIYFLLLELEFLESYWWLFSLRLNEFDLILAYFFNEWNLFFLILVGYFSIKINVFYFFYCGFFLTEKNVDVSLRFGVGFIYEACCFLRFLVFDLSFCIPVCMTKSS